MQETSKVFEKILQLLERAGVEYELLRHEPVRTAQEASKIRGTSIKEGVKAIIFAADGEPFLICVSGDRRIDSKEFKRTYGVKDLRLLSPEEVLQLTGLEVGAIPPLGKAMNLPSYLDRAVLEKRSGGIDLPLTHSACVLPLAQLWQLRRQFGTLSEALLGA